MKIICIGRNYVDHAKELNNPVPEEPVIFMKPQTALVVNGKPLFYPNFSKSVHYEGELVLKIGKNGRHVNEQFALKYVEEITIGVDFTARDVQSRLKEKGLPWEISKGFDGAAAIGKWITLEDWSKPIDFTLSKNGKVVQQGDTADMIFSFAQIISYVSQFFTLQMGDYIFTGTPAGVGEVQIGDQLKGSIQGTPLLSFYVR